MMKSTRLRVRQIERPHRQSPDAADEKGWPDKGQDGFGKKADAHRLLPLLGIASLADASGWSRAKRSTGSIQKSM